MFIIAYTKKLEKLLNDLTAYLKDYRNEQAKPKIRKIKDTKIRGLEKQ